jgi:(p)ppGpp synthase/HD superfamily hydrolase
MGCNRWSQETYITAYRFAAYAHRGQTVPGTDLPYIMHLSFVCMEVLAALTVETGHDENLAIQCALLHDVLEDTATTYAQVQTAFGPAVAAGVLALSKDAALAKPLQLADSLRRICQQAPEIWMVKLADRITNLQPPPAYWTDDKRVQYRQEAIHIHTALGVASPFLAARLLTKIDAYSTYLGAHNLVHEER